MPEAPAIMQPLTFGGVASFASASLARLFAFQLAVAAIAAAAVVLAFSFAWEPPFREAINALPATGRIFNGRLEWTGDSPARLSTGKFLAILVDVANSRELDQASDLQCKFTATHLELQSWLGYMRLPYPSGYVIRFNRPELEPWWGAWAWGAQALLAGWVVVSLFASWWSLSFLYLFPVAIMSLIAGRQITFTSAWKMAAAALLPGALLMSAAIAAYGLDRINLIQFAFAVLLHFAIGWIYVFFSPFRLPKGAAAMADPFAAPDEPETPARPAKTKPKNPFASPIDPSEEED